MTGTTVRPNGRTARNITTGNIMNTDTEERNQQTAAAWPWAVVDARISRRHVVNRFRYYVDAVRWAHASGLHVCELPTVQQVDIF